MIKKAIYAGSFDPFTKGHEQIVLDSAKIFDEVTILLAVNSDKRRRLNILSCENAIKETFKDNPKIKVESYKGFVVDYCKKNGINYLIRGLRNSNDFTYEENIAKINAELNPDVKTIYFRTSNEIISSSMVWELYIGGKDVSKFLPAPIYKILNEHTRSQL
ncbi:MAG: pantetheine-phosphate adenylyltransferase [Clostridia bacterium]